MVSPGFQPWATLRKFRRSATPARAPETKKAAPTSGLFFHNCFDVREFTQLKPIASSGPASVVPRSTPLFADGSISA